MILCLTVGIGKSTETKLETSEFTIADSYMIPIEGVIWWDLHFAQIAWIVTCWG